MGFSLLQQQDAAAHNSNSYPSSSGRGMRVDEIFGFQSINTAASGCGRFETRVPITNAGDVCGGSIVGSGDMVGGGGAQQPHHSSVAPMNAAIGDDLSSSSSGGSNSTNLQAGGGGGGDKRSPGVSGNLLDSILQLHRSTATYKPVVSQSPSVTPPTAWNTDIPSSRQSDRRRPQIHFLDELPPQRH